MSGLISYHKAKELHDQTFPGGEKLMCEVCGLEQAVGVACSPLGAVSLAYGRNCLNFGADALWMIDATIDCCCGPEHMASWFWGMMTYKDGKYLSAAQVYGRQATMDLI
jgi:hypothetical protein